MNSNIRGQFLMRRIEYTPDFVNIYCDIKIKWLQEIYFRSIIEMPRVLFNKKRFSNVKIFDTFIQISLIEWVDFLKDIASSFRENEELRNIAISNIKRQLKQSSKMINNIFDDMYSKGNMLKANELKKIINCFIDLDTFAVFNMFIPYDMYDEILSKYGLENSNVDDIMVCAFTPHRILIRKNKLKLALMQKKDEDIEKHIEKYIKNIMVYEEFENWSFDNVKLKNNRFLIKEIKAIANEFEEKEIIEELEKIDNNRHRQVNKINSFYEKLNEKLESIENKEKRCIFNKLGFLSIIVSEEEERHMIECKIFAIMGEVFKKCKLDVSRSDIDTIIKTYAYVGGE